MKKITGLLFITMVFFLSCKKDKKTNPEPEPAPVVSKGSLKIDFEHLVNSEALVFNQNYTNANGDTFKVTKFNYFISNIIITNNDNSTYSEPDSYHLIKQSDAATKIITLTNVPSGSYRSINFMLGIDSAKNCSGAHLGDLDYATVASDMFWTWNTGYIMLKMEGTSPVSTAGNKVIQIHMGGYYGVNKVQRNFGFEFAGTTANVTEATTPVIRLSVNVNELFKTPSVINFSVQPTQVTAGPGAKTFADNYADMITFKSVQN